MCNNQPKSRMVLMKGYDREGLCFYTHYNSAKGIQIDKNPNASMLFYWPHVDRQVILSDFHHLGIVQIRVSRRVNEVKAEFLGLISHWFSDLFCSEIY